MHRIHITPEMYVLLAQLALILFLVIRTVRERKSETRLRCLNHHLIENQEEERKHIARELHDDLGQRLALIKLDLEMAMQEDLSLKGEGTQSRWDGILLGLDELGSDIQRLSHTLHSGRLRYLGLKAALKELCGKFQKQHRIAIDLRMEGFTNPASKDVELCIYRVVQEALQNMAKHSCADYAVLKLADDGEMLQMEISDNGKGFTHAEASRRMGLGLASMRERLSILGGNLQVKSAPGRGTILSARVRLESTRASYPSTA